MVPSLISFMFFFLSPAIYIQTVYILFFRYYFSATVNSQFLSLLYHVFPIQALLISHLHLLIYIKIHLSTYNMHIAIQNRICYNANRQNDKNSPRWTANEKPEGVADLRAFLFHFLQLYHLELTSKGHIQKNPLKIPRIHHKSRVSTVNYFVYAHFPLK